jgi:catechol 2,3-dioxygenase-like lactoylglutathione lyase family enzyme
MGVTHVFAGIPVADRDAAVQWYTRFFGRPPDLLPNAVEAAWRATDSGWVYVIADRERAGTALHTLLVDHLDTFLAGLAERGIDAGEVESLDGDAVRRSSLRDPDGNRLNIGEPRG